MASFISGISNWGIQIIFDRFIKEDKIIIEDKDQLNKSFTEHYANYLAQKISKRRHIS